jgi:hypothetical protein
MSLPFWARSKFVFLIVLLYLAIHFTIRMAMPPGLSVDDAEQALLTQDYAWAYRYKAPPLFNWLLTTLSHVLPVNRLSISVLRYTLLGVLYAFIYLTARRLLTDPRLAALSVYSFAAINPFAEASHRNLTHSTMLTAVTAISWYVFFRLAASPRLGWYLALGAAFGFGMLSKWNFTILVLALPFACLLSRDHRHLVLTWKVVPAGLLAAAIVLPTVIATLRLQPPAEDQVGTILSLETGWSPAQMLRGTLNLLDAAITYSLPFLPIVVILFAPPLLRGFRAVGSGSAAPALRANAMLIGTAIAIGLAILWALVIAGGATTFKVRYLYQVLLFLPVWLFLIIEAGRPSDRSLKVFALVLAALAIFVTGKRIAHATGQLSCGVCVEWRPHGALASQLTDAGFKGDGTVLTDLETGGNMRVYFPRARIIDPTYPLAIRRVPTDAGQCLVLYGEDGDARHREASLQRYESYLEGFLGGRGDAPHREGVASAAMLPPATGILRLGYRLYETPNGECR